jgi:hypothetical protein
VDEPAIEQKKYFQIEVDSNILTIGTFTPFNYILKDYYGGGQKDI